MSEDWRTLGKAMRDAQRAYHDVPGQGSLRYVRAAEAAFDKPPAAPPAKPAALDAGEAVTSLNALQDAVLHGEEAAVIGGLFNRHRTALEAAIVRAAFLQRENEYLKTRGRASAESAAAAIARAEKAERQRDEAREALKEARQTILDLKNARGSEAEGTDAEWVAKIDATLSGESAASESEGV